MDQDSTPGVGAAFRNPMTAGEHPATPRLLLALIPLDQRAMRLGPLLLASAVTLISTVWSHGAPRIQPTAI